jgi:thiaminase/transcriptional activator TenA
MNQGFSAAMRARTAGLLARTTAMPFNAELAAGTLDRERFRRYIVQDALYLAEYGRALALIGSKAQRPGHVAWFAKAAEGIITAERSLHEHYFGGYGLTPAEAAAVEPSPACLLYTSFLLVAAHQEGFAVGVAAVVPCFRVYWDVGRHIAAHAAPDNPYQAWIANYSDPAFGTSVAAVEAIADAEAEAGGESLRTRMAYAYLRAAQLEWMFWDACYRGEDWPDPVRA